ARRCISYLTIEHKGPIDRALRPAFGNRIYGCDDRLAACPWNKFAASAREMKLVAREDLKAPDIASFLALDDPTFRTYFSGSPVKRIGRDRFVRNVLIAAGNSGSVDLAPACKALLNDASADVRGMAVWALSRLLAPQQFAALKAEHLVNETDEHVRQEWMTGS
ncbi:MAG: epoxyqueuosine reductase, partial [Allorhizobium sp.]